MNHSRRDRLPEASAGARRGGARRAAGFTLAEVIIAIALLAAALTNVLALFPASMHLAAETSQDAVGTIMCRNGLALAMVRLRHPGPGSPLPVPFGLDLGEPQMQPLAQEDRTYPIHGEGQSAGFLLLGRQIEAGKNDYQLIVIACQVLTEGGGFEAVSVSGVNIQNNEGKMQAVFTGGAGNVQVGSPMIVASGPNAGAFGYVSVVNDDVNTAMLDIGEDGMPTGDGFTVWLVKETGSSTSPALKMMTTRTALKVHTVDAPE